ncbi:hypothetical protein HJFPF1_13571 [Paramyrothecium foliicola]|nr:hypothetical protein HJFPF1_13571 [Paramyrothecium foliicola]
MTTPLDDLLKHAAAEGFEAFDPDFVLAEQLPYVTEGAKIRLDNLKIMLASFYSAVTSQDWSAVQLWCKKLRDWEHLKFGIPQEVRATLAALVCNLAFAPGLPLGMGDLEQVFNDLTWDKNRLCYYVDASRDMMLHKKLNWKQMIERLKSPYLGFNNNMVQEVFDPFGILYHAQALLDPRDRMTILGSLLPFFDTAHPDTHSGTQVTKLITAMVPTAPAPAVSSDCQPAAILPMLFHMFFRQHYGYQDTANYVQLFSRFAVSHLGYDHVSFGPYGIFDPAQSDAIFKAISRLMLLDDEEGGQSFFDPPIPGFLPFDRREQQGTLAYRIAEGIVYSLSPVCETQQRSMLSSLESLVDSVYILYHPNVDHPSIFFVTRFLLEVAHCFSRRYYGEQTGKLEIPLNRRLTPALKRKFVLLIRRPLLLGAFSLHKVFEGFYSYRISTLSHETLQVLADLEPDLIIPAALRSFYINKHSEVDGDAAYLSLSLLHSLSSIMVREKGFRCHAPFLMRLAYEGVNRNNAKLTAIVARLVKTTMCSFPWLLLTADSSSVKPADVEQWAMGEMERLCLEGPEVEVAYRKELSNHYESALLQSAAINIQSLAQKFLWIALNFLAQSYTNEDQILGSIPQNDSELDSATSHLTDAACECLHLLSLEQLDSFVQEMVQLLISKPLPRATIYAVRILEAVTLLYPDRSFNIFVPKLIDKVKHEVESERQDTKRRYESLMSPGYNLDWYARLLACCFRVGGELNYQYTGNLLDLVRNIEELPILRVSPLSDYLITDLIAGLTRTYAAKYEVVSANFAVSSSHSWGWDDVETKIIWHVPSRDSLSAAYRIFDARLFHHEGSIHKLLDEYPRTQASARKDILQRLADALSGISELFCAGATLLDPQFASDNMDSGHYAMKWHAKDMQPGLCNQKMHERRSKIIRLAAEGNKLLASYDDDTITYFEALLNLFRTLIGDVGTCREHGATGTTRNDCDLWALDFQYRPGNRPRYPPALQIWDLNCYHVETQRFATACRGIGDVEEAAGLVLVDGCCSPYKDVANQAQYVLEMTLDTIMGFTSHFLSPMLRKTVELVEQYDPSNNDSYRRIVPRILNALQSLLAGKAQNLEKPMLWARDCPSRLPELVGLLMNAIGTQHDEISKLAINGLQLLEQRAIWDSRAFPDLRCAEAIRPAKKDTEAIRKAWESREGCRAEIATRMRTLGLEMLNNMKDQRHYIEFARTIFVSFPPKPHPASYVNMLAEGAVSGNLKIRQACMRGFTDLIRVCLVEKIYGDDLKAYVHNRGRISHGLIKLNPRLDKDKIERVFGETNDGTDVFVDNMGVGSLVWGEFEAFSEGLPPLESETLVRLSTCFTHDWFRHLANILHHDEMPEEEQGMDCREGPVLDESLVDFLACVFTLMGHGNTVAVLEDIKFLVSQAFGTGRDVSNHTMAATILAALLLASASSDFRWQVLDFATLTVVDILDHKLTPGAKDIWNQFLTLTFRGRDPTRYAELVRYIISLRLDSLCTAFQNECKLMAVHVAVDEWGWRLSRDQPLLDNLLAHQKGEIPSVTVSTKIGSILADVDIRRFRISAPDVETLATSNKAASPLGLAPYPSNTGLKEMATRIWATVARQRMETPPDVSVHSESYMHACRVACAWLEKILRSSTSTVIMSLFDFFFDELFHMLDMRHADEEDIRIAASNILIELSHLQFDDTGAEMYLEAVIERAWAGSDGSMMHLISCGDKGDRLIGDMADTYRNFVEKQLDLKVPELLLSIVSRIQRRQSRRVLSSSTLRARRMAMATLRLFYLRRLVGSNLLGEQLSVQLVIWTQICDEHVDIRGIASVTLKDMLSRSRSAMGEMFARKLVIAGKEQLRESRSREAKGKCKSKETKDIRKQHMGVLWLTIAVTSFPCEVRPKRWMIDAAEAISSVAAARNSSIVTRDALENFRGDRRTEWETIKQVNTEFLSSFYVLTWLFSCRFCQSLCCRISKTRWEIRPMPSLERSIAVPRDEATGQHCLMCATHRNHLAQNKAWLINYGRFYKASEFGEAITLAKAGGFKPIHASAIPVSVTEQQVINPRLSRLRSAQLISPNMNALL